MYLDYPLSSSLPSQAEEASSRVAKLQSTLANDSSGQAASDALSEEIAQLKAGVAAERVRFSHMTEALEATKGSVEEVSVQPTFDLYGAKGRLNAPRMRHFLGCLPMLNSGFSCLENDFYNSGSKRRPPAYYIHPSIHPFARRSPV